MSLPARYRAGFLFPGELKEGPEDALTSERVAITSNDKKKCLANDLNRLRRMGKSDQHLRWIGVITLEYLN